LSLQYLFPGPAFISQEFVRDYPPGQGLSVSKHTGDTAG